MRRRRGGGGGGWGDDGRWYEFAVRGWGWGLCGLVSVYGFAEDLLEFLEFVVEEFWGIGFEVESEHGFGVAFSDVEPPVAGVDGDAVEVIDLGFAVGFGEFADFGVFVFDLEVDFAGLGVAAEWCDELAEGFVLGGEDGEESCEGDSAGVGEEVIAEVEMSGEFAAEDGVGFGEGFFHEGVSDAFAAGYSAGGGDFVGDDMAGSEVVDDGGAFVFGFGEKVAGEEGGDEVAADGVAGFGEEHAAVAVAVEAGTEVGFALGHFGLEHLEVGFDEGVGVVGEGAGGFEEDGDDMEVWDVGEDGGDHFAGHAVGGIDGDADFSREVEELEDVFAVLRPEVFGFEFTGDAGGSDAEGRGDAFDIFEAGGGADGFGIRAGDFEAVVLGGVVGGGDLNSADGLFVVNGEVDEGGIDHADVDDVHACGSEAVDEGIGEFRGTGSHIAADDHGVFVGDALGVGDGLSGAFEELSGGVADFPGGLFVEGVGVGGAHVVGFEHFVHHGGDYMGWRGWG